MVNISPMISIIVPVYKVEQYLPYCINSILAQSFSDFELILVDDGSPDACPAICDEYARKDSRIRVVHQKNGGLSAARNTGIAEAKGEYLCFVDSDDCICDAYCRMLLQAVTMSGCKIAACAVRRFSADSELSDGIGVSADGGLPVEVMPFADFLVKQMTGQMEMGVWNRIYHRSVFAGIRFAPGKLHEDIIFAADLLEQPELQVACLDIPLYYYRQRANSIVNQQVSAARCSPDRVFAGQYLLDTAKKKRYRYMDQCLYYAVDYPWYFADPIYVHRTFRKNREFLNALQKLLRKYSSEYKSLAHFDEIRRKRMRLFAASRILYGFNAYARLFRVYLYHVIKKDPYADGHGI